MAGYPAELHGTWLPLDISCATLDTPKIELRNAVKVCATVLAPATELKVKDTAEFSGAFRGKRMKVERDANVHCAEARPAPITWIEQR